MRQLLIDSEITTQLSLQLYRLYTNKT